MKRSDFFIRLTTGVLFLAVACYIGVYLYRAFVNAYETTEAIRYSIEETLPAQGFIVRTESVITDGGAAFLPIVSEGEKVSSGQVIAVEYLSRDALEIASEIRSLRIKIAQMESARDNTDAAGFNAILELSAAVSNHDLRRLDELAFSIETSIFSVETDTTIMRERLEDLEGRNVGTRNITSNASGTFSHIVDGFEHINPDMLINISPDELAELFNTSSGIYGGGKLITEFKWYYAAVMNHEDAFQLSAGQIKTVQFYGAYNVEIDMLVENTGRREDGKSVVLFSSDRGVHDIAPMRSLRADIVLDVISGIRIPKEAIHLDDEGNTFIYLQTSGYAERVDVEILNPPGEIGDSYLVRDGAETGSPLRVDSIIIVKANNLYHGKVVT
ncbi:MAG: hypothetical protein FWD38_02285 [Oscillospiraceae bacterium]|nr:hypothetical protein [Oscillospiraceae bacterium]